MTRKTIMILGIGAVAGTTIFVVLSTIGFLFWAYYNKGHQCIALPIGLNIGWEAVFDLDEYFLRPGTTVKYPNGAPIVEEELFSVQYTDTTLHGSTVAREGNNIGYQFAWRADTGVVREADDRETYNAIIAEAKAKGAQLPPWFELLNVRSLRHRCRSRFVTW